MTLSDNTWLYGSEAPLPPRRKLKVGSLSADLIEGQLRNIKLGDILILQRIYSALRDENWATSAGQLTILEDSQTDDALHLAFESIHQHSEIDFRWHGTITMTPMSLTFAMDGEAHSTFKRNRIGFCVLHYASVAGSDCQLEFVDGSRQDAQFPKLIAPHQPYFNLRAITHEPAPNVRVTVLMEGDTFEMEDQRNWTDASFKTYCTPLGLLFPVTVEKGTRIQQRIELTCVGDAPMSEITDNEVIVIRATNQFTHLPSIGTCYRGDKLTSQQVKLFENLALNHLRVDLDLARDNIKDILDNTADLVNPYEHWHVELVLWLRDNPESELKAFTSLIEAHPYFANHGTFTVFEHGYKTTSDDTMKLAERLLPKRAIYGGTDAFFTELNRNRPDVSVEAFSGVNYSTNPQVHAFDNNSLIETLAIQGETLRSTRAFVKPSWHINVSPISLKMRWNPNATSEPTPTPVGELPAHVDTRQMSLFGAVWTLGSLKHNMENGAHSLTYYTTHGYDGLMPYAGDNPLSHLFPDVGLVHPLYHVFAGISNRLDKIEHTVSDKPLQAEALYLRNQKQHRILVANYKPYAQTVQLEGIKGTFRAKELSLQTVEQACANPLTFINDWTLQHIVTNGHLQITLSPYAIYFLEQAE